MLEPVNEASMPASAEQHRVGQLSHAQAPAGVVECEQHLVGGEGQRVGGHQLVVERAGHAGVHAQQAAPGRELVGVQLPAARTGIAGLWGRSGLVRHEGSLALCRRSRMSFGGAEDARIVLKELRVPIVQAPMAGGPSTPALAAAVSQSGGLGFVAAGYKSADAMAADLEETRSQTERPFGVNLFVPGEGPADPAAVSAYAERLRPEARAADVELGAPRFDDDAFNAKLDRLLEQPAAVVSFTFGCPEPSVVSELQSVGSSVWATVTDVSEAARAEAARVDALVVQGAEAGGHRGSFVDRPERVDYGTLALLQLVDRHVEVPLVATGGITTGAGVAAALAAGAAAAQLGTAFMLCPEAGTAAAHRVAITSSTPTGLTRA